MSNEIILLLESINNPGIFVSDKRPGAGYHQKYDNLHTFSMTFSSWSGELRLQGTLDIFPDDASWVDLVDTEDRPVIFSSYDGIAAVNVRGNFIWIRAIGTLNTGSIAQIQFSH